MVLSSSSSSLLLLLLGFVGGGGVWLVGYSPLHGFLLVWKLRVSVSVIFVVGAVFGFAVVVDMI